MRQSNLYTLTFVVIVSFAAALILSVSSTVLKERQRKNAELDVKMNILLAMDILKSGEDIEKLYHQSVSGIVVNSAGDVLSDAPPAENIDFESELEKEPAARRLPVFINRNRDGKVSSYCIPIVGKGLWSTLYGYLALERDMNGIKGITFYRHGETPGLGGEIESPAFQNSFRGKRIFSGEGKLVSVTVVKGHVKSDSPSLIHEVDGISGATLTSQGVSRLLKMSLSQYEPYFKKSMQKKR